MDFSHIDLSVFNKNTFVECYGKTIYENSTCIFKDETTLEYKYPGLALFDYLTQNKKLKFNNFVIFGTSSSYWFNLALNFKDFFNRKNIKFPYADQIAGEKIPKDSPIPEGAIYGQTPCSKEDITRIENEINKILQKEFNCTFKIIIHSDDVSNLVAQTDIIKKLYENKEIFQDQHIYFDITYSMRFIPLLILTGFNCLQISGDLKIENIFYDQLYKRENDNNQCYIRELKFVDRIFKESYVYEVHKDMMSLKPLASLIGDEALKQKVLNCNRLINMQSYGLARSLYKKLQPQLKNYFKDSSVFSDKFFNDIENLINDERALINKFIQANNLFNAIFLLEKNYPKLQDEKIFNSHQSLFKNDFRDPIFHYRRIDSQVAIDNINDLKNKLVSYIGKKIDFKLKSEVVPKVNIKTLFSFLGSGKYNKIRYHDLDDNVLTSTFLGNSLAFDVLKNSKIDRYVVLGTYTSGWTIFIDTLLEYFDQSKEEIKELKYVFYKYQNQETKTIILNAQAVEEINNTFAKYKEILQLNVEIYAYDEQNEYKVNFKNLNNFIFNKVEYGQDFYMDITHSFRDIPIISLLAAYSIQTVKQANLLKLYYGYIDPTAEENSKDSGYLVDLSYLLSLFDDAQNISSFAESSNVKYIIPTIIKFYHNNPELIQNLTDAATYESSYIFKKSIKLYQLVLEELKTNKIEDPIYSLIYPTLINSLESYLWEDNIGGFRRRAKFYAQEDYLAQAIFAVYQAYQELFIKYTELHLDQRVDSIKESTLKSKVTDLLASVDQNYQERVDSYQKNCGRAPTRNSCKAMLVISLVDTLLGSYKNQYSYIRKIRKYISGEMSEQQIKDFEKDFFDFDHSYNSKRIFKIINKSLEEVKELTNTVKNLNDEIKKAKGK